MNGMRRDRAGWNRRRKPDAGAAERRGGPRRAESEGARHEAGFRKPGPDLVVLYGLHAVREALRAKKRKLLDLFPTGPGAERIAGEAADAGVAVHVVEGVDLDRRLGPGAVHQGLMLEARAL